MRSADGRPDLGGPQARIAARLQQPRHPPRRHTGSTRRWRRRSDLAGSPARPGRPPTRAGPALRMGRRRRSVDPRLWYVRPAPDLRREPPTTAATRRRSSCRRDGEQTGDRSHPASDEAKLHNPNPRMPYALATLPGCRMGSSSACATARAAGQRRPVRQLRADRDRDSRHPHDVRCARYRDSGISLQDQKRGHTDSSLISCQPLALNYNGVFFGLS